MDGGTGEPKNCRRKKIKTKNLQAIFWNSSCDINEWISGFGLSSVIRSAVKFVGLVRHAPVAAVVAVRYWAVNKLLFAEGLEVFGLHKPLTFQGGDCGEGPATTTWALFSKLKIIMSNPRSRSRLIWSGTKCIFFTHYWHIS